MSIFMVSSKISNLPTSPNNSSAEVSEISISFQPVLVKGVVDLGFEVTWNEKPFISFDSSYIYRRSADSLYFGVSVNPKDLRALQLLLDYKSTRVNPFWAMKIVEECLWEINLEAPMSSLFNTHRDP